MGWLDAVVSGAATAIGGFLSTKANSDAADKAAEANIRGYEMQAAENEKARQELRRNKAAAQGYLNTGRLGALQYVTAMPEQYRETIAPMLAGPDQLTPSQVIAMEDMRRENNATLAASGLRGAGRAGVGLAMDANRRFLADAYDRNQQRGDTARYALGDVVADSSRMGANIEQGTGTAKANTEIGVGSNIAGTYTNQGTAANLAQQRAGEARAGAITANAQVLNDTFGALAGIIAEENKAQQVKPRFAV